MQEELSGKMELNSDGIIKIGDLKEGIWAVYKIPRGKHMTHIMDRVDDLPEVLRLSQIEAIRQDISKEISGALIDAGVMEVFRGEGWSVRRVVNNIFKTLKDTLGKKGG